MSSICDNVIFLGNRNDVDRLYQAMDVFVLPSRYEGLPVVGVEAQAAGLPCVLSDKMTKETKMTDSVVFLSIDNGAKEWVKSIQDRSFTKRNIRAYEGILENGFAISGCASKLMAFYGGKLK